MHIPPFVRGHELLPMETFLVVCPITPFNKSIPPRRTPWYPPMPQPQVPHHPLKRRDPCGMRGVGHGEHHGIIRDHEMEWRQARHRLGQDTSNHGAGLGWMNFGIFDPCPQVNHADFVFPAPLALNCGQFLHIQLRPIAANGNVPR